MYQPGTELKKKQAGWLFFLILNLIIDKNLIIIANYAIGRFSKKEQNKETRF